MTDLNTLASMVEAATGPDRELDAAIGAHLQRCRLAMDSGATHDSIRPDQSHPGRIIDAGGGWLAPAYTASLDAAMTLVPEGCEWSVNWSGNSVANVNRIGDGYPIHCGYAATPALALCAAALRSRAAMGDG